MRDDVTVCIPTYNAPGRAEMCKRAVQSAETQARVAVYDDRDEPHGHCHAAWWNALWMAQTPYVVLLFDDDWLEPNFIEQAMRWMDEGKAPYSFTDAWIHMPGQEPRVNLGLEHIVNEDGYATAQDMETLFSMMLLTISPSCGVFRRETALSCLLVGSTPNAPHRSIECGPDLLMWLLPLLKWKEVGITRAPLAHFDGHADSATIRARATPGGLDDLAAGYRDARDFWMLLRGRAP